MLQKHCIGSFSCWSKTSLFFANAELVKWGEGWRSHSQSALSLRAPILHVALIWLFVIHELAGGEEQILDKKHDWLMWMLRMVSSSSTMWRLFYYLISASFVQSHGTKKMVAAGDWIYILNWKEVRTKSPATSFQSFWKEKKKSWQRSSYRSQHTCAD